jgi:hypothetical protein
LWWRSLEITSVPKIKRKGDNGSPCRKPLEGRKRPKGDPFNRTENEEVVIQSLIQLIH